jgi:hypothetical protein
MTVTNIPDDHHFVRHCRNSQYYMHNGKIRPHPEAFHLRPATATMPEEDTLSGVYYEWFDGTAEEKMKASCQFIGVTIKRKDALLRMNSGLIKKQGMTRSLKVRVTHEPDRSCPPYAAIRGMPRPPDNELCALLASLSVIDAIDFESVCDL